VRDAHLYVAAASIPLLLHHQNTCHDLQIYLPGIDGTGLAAWQQFPMIVHRCALVSLNVPVQDRTSFPDLVDICVEYLEVLAGQVATDRPIYLLGESFGGVLAIAVADRCRDIVDRMVLVNPATSYEDSYWLAVRAQPRCSTR
jgi:pimeloyl-ACP methyl ester carboxylesterase